MTLDQLLEARKRAAAGHDQERLAELDRAIAKKLKAGEMRRRLRQLSIGQREEADAIKRSLRQMGEPTGTHQLEASDSATKRKALLSRADALEAEARMTERRGDAAAARRLREQASQLRRAAAGSSDDPAVAEALAKDATLKSLREDLATAPDAETAAWIQEQIRRREEKVRAEAKASKQRAGGDDPADEARSSLLDAADAERRGEYGAAASLSKHASTRLGDAAADAYQAGDYTSAAGLRKQAARALADAARQAEAAGDYAQAARLQERAAGELENAAAALAKSGDQAGALALKRKAADALEEAARRAAAAGDLKSARRLRAKAKALRDEIARPRAATATQRSGPARPTRMSCGAGSTKLSATASTRKQPGYSKCSTASYPRRPHRAEAHSNSS